MLDGRRDAAFLVEVDRCHGASRRLIDEDGGQPAACEGVERRVVARQAVGHEPVDGGSGDPRRRRAAAGAVAGEEQQGDVGGRHRLGDAVEDLQRRRIAEGVRQAVGEDHPDSSRRGPRRSPAAWGSGPA